MSKWRSFRCWRGHKWHFNLIPHKTYFPTMIIIKTNWWSGTPPRPEDWCLIFSGPKIVMPASPPGPLIQEFFIIISDNVSFSQVTVGSPMKIASVLSRMPVFDSGTILIDHAPLLCVCPDNHHFLFSPGGFFLTHVQESQKKVPHAFFSNPVLMAQARWP